MALVVVKVNDQKCRSVIASNFTHSFCGATLAKKHGWKIEALEEGAAPSVSASDGTPIDFVGQLSVQMELGPWKSASRRLLVSSDCPADLLLGQDLCAEIERQFGQPIKFEYYKNALFIGGTRVSMLDQMSVEEKFHTLQVQESRNSNKSVSMAAWKRDDAWKGRGRAKGGDQA